MTSSLPDANNLTTIDNLIFGFTEATGGATQNLTVTNFAIGFYCTSYQVWNTTGARSDFYLNGACRNGIKDNREITDVTTNRLATGGIISRDSNAGSCSPGTPLDSINFTQAVVADADGNCLINYGPGGTLSDR